MLKEIYIVGAGGLAKDMYLLLEEINQHQPTWNIKGFVDYQPTQNFLTIARKQIPILDENLFFESQAEALNQVAVVFGIGFPRLRHKVLEKWGEQFVFPNLIHPSCAQITRFVEMGQGNVINAGCNFSVCIEIGDFNCFNPGAIVGHDTCLGSRNVINPGAVISGGVRIGDMNLIGTHATVLQYLTIGSDNLIGAGSVINRSVGNHQVVAGVPGKLIREHH